MINFRPVILGQFQIGADRNLPRSSPLQQNCVAGGESQHDTDSWRKRAEDARAIAESMKSFSEKQKIEAIAAA